MKTPRPLEDRQEEMRDRMREARHNRRMQIYGRHQERLEDERSSAPAPVIAAPKKEARPYEPLVIKDPNKKRGWSKGRTLVPITRADRERVLGCHAIGDTIAMISMRCGLAKHYVSKILKEAGKTGHRHPRLKEAADIRNRFARGK